MPSDATSYDAVVHVIQLSLSPIFLLSAVATLLGVFTTRLARISDRVHRLSETSAGANRDETDAHLAYLRRRSHILDAAVILAGLAGACTCGTVLTLFFGIVRGKAALGLLFGLFGAGILCTLGALAAFLAEVLLGSRGIRAVAARGAEGAGDADKLKGAKTKDTKTKGAKPVD